LLNIFNIFFILFYFCLGQGGAFHFHVYEEGYLTMNNTIIAGCHSNIEGGGGISIHGVLNVIENTAFLFCVSWADVDSEEPHRDIGGAIRFWNTNGQLKNCSFINCGSKSHGGALGHARFNNENDENIPQGKLIELTNCIFASNWATYDGGAIIMQQDSYDCLNCSFLHNRAGRSGSAFGGEFYGSVTFTSCIFVKNWNNDSCDSSRGRGAISIWPLDGGTSKTLTVKDCSFYFNFVADDLSCLGIGFFFFCFIIILLCILVPVFGNDLTQIGSGTNPNNMVKNNFINSCSNSEDNKVRLFIYLSFI
jgi:hypothetical protein